MIFEMRTDVNGSVPREDIDIVVSVCLKGFSWTVIWVERGIGRDVPLLVPMSDEHHQRTAEARLLSYYHMTRDEQLSVRRALGPFDPADQLILTRMHVQDSEKHLLHLNPEAVDERLEPGRKRFLEEAKYTTMFELAPWSDLGVTDFVAWVKGLEDPFIERIIS